MRTVARLHRSSVYFVYNTLAVVTPWLHFITGCTTGCKLYEHFYRGNFLTTAIGHASVFFHPAFKSTDIELDFLRVNGS